MALTGVLRPGFAQIRVTDMDAAIKHYVDRVGLNEVSREPDGRVYLRAFDEFDRHCLVLRTADQPGIDRVAFKVAGEADLSHFVERIKAAGLAVEDIPAGSNLALAGESALLSRRAIRSTFTRRWPCHSKAR